MPITQDRFIAILNVSADVLDAWDSLRDVTQPVAETIVNLASAIQRMPQGPDRGAMELALGTMTQIHSTLTETNQLSANQRVAIAVEREHFRKTHRRNAKMASAQRRARINRRGTDAVATRQQGPIHAGVSTEVDYKPSATTTITEELDNIPPSNYDVEQDPAYLKLLEEQKAKWSKAQ